MQVKTILNQCHRFKSFVYDKVRFVVENGERLIEVTVIPRRNSRAICSNCGRPAPTKQASDRDRKMYSNQINRNRKGRFLKFHRSGYAGNLSTRSRVKSAT